LQTPRQLADEETRHVRLDEVPVDEVDGSSRDPYSDEGVVCRIDASGIAALTLMRRLCPSVHEDHPGLLLLDPSLTLNQGVHCMIEGVQIP
jgi:hypothetical protein